MSEELGDITISEDYIDLQYEKLKYDHLKESLFKDILKQVLEHLSADSTLSSNVTVRKKEKTYVRYEADRGEDCTISFLIKEIEFLREEIKEKNNIIASLTTESLMQNDSKSAEKNDLIRNKNVLLHENQNLICEIPMDNSEQTNKERLAKQLKEVRDEQKLNYHRYKIVSVGNKNINEQNIQNHCDKNCIDIVKEAAKCTGSVNEITVSKNKNFNRKML